VTDSHTSATPLSSSAHSGNTCSHLRLSMLQAGGRSVLQKSKRLGEQGIIHWPRANADVRVVDNPHYMYH
ncbi:hypothetical protein BOTBODRAFT_37836, partial [Botryobasidium botryosum FD-172 SS1]